MNSKTASGDVVPSTIRQMLAPIASAKVFGEDFLQIYGECEWVDDRRNKAAAHQFRTELISRIATARLTYGSGTEKRALGSIADLFQKARDITAANVGCGTFEVLTWHAMNAHVRHFTAKWHPLSENGGLDALDSTDDFRAELYEIQENLRELERALALLGGGGASYDPANELTEAKGGAAPDRAVWRPAGGERDFAVREQAAVERRRKQYQISREGWAAGLALSGGGIRSATFSLGVLASLSRRNLLPEFDYLSTVSGGGYAGCFLTSLLGRPDLPDAMGLKGDQEPFRRVEQESELLMGIRQRASFLSGGPWERLLLVMRSTYGVFVHIVLLCGLLAFVAAFELMWRQVLDQPWISASYGWIFPILSIVLLSFVSRMKKLQLDQLTAWHFMLGSSFCLPLIWIAWGGFHTGTEYLSERLNSVLSVRGMSASLLMSALATAILGAIAAVFAWARSVSAVGIAVMFLLLVEHSFFTTFNHQANFDTGLTLLGVAAVVVVLWWWVDVNETSLYRYYRSKLATAFVYRDAQSSPPKISEFVADYSFYPIVNCALNAPGSKLPAMRGRLSDVFAFTPIMTGSKIIGYHDTQSWEDRNRDLDLAGAMALSGAAVSPQMGLRTTSHGSFWLTLFNARLSAWLKNPGTSESRNDVAKPTLFASLKRSGPGYGYLVREFTATANEKLEYVNISDGGHIENLGVYELLRRRCRYILAIDGENDPRMTFHALTNLQRLAYIDMGVLIDAELDELRLQPSGFSRSHFRFCRVRYPTGNPEAPWEIGYLLYLKLSLTGNEGEFLRRYRLDEPTFPHHSTADQFFTETQFEAYRSLGEHIGDKLFMRAIIDDLADKQALGVDEWMNRYAENFLKELPGEKSARSA